MTDDILESSPAIGTESLEELDNGTFYVPYSERPETYIVPLVFFIIFVVGVLGNGTLVLMFARNRNMRNVPNTYIFSLALGDLLVILTCVPFTSTVYTLESWPYGHAVCKLSEVTKDVSIGVSVFTLTALSAERYFAIARPLRRQASHGARPITLVSALGIWILAVLLAAPDGINATVEARILDGQNHTLLFCTPFPKILGKSYPVTMVIFKFLTYYAVPLCIIAVFYLCMARHLELSTRNMPGELPGQIGNQSAQARARRKVAKMVLAFVVIFVVCFLPYHVVSLWFFIYPNAEDEYNNFWHSLRIIGFCLTFINSCVNPVALYCVSGVFRKHFNQYLFCCCNQGGGRQALSEQHTQVHFRRLNYSRDFSVSRTTAQTICCEPTHLNNHSSRPRDGLAHRARLASLNGGTGVSVDQEDVNVDHVIICSD